MRFQRTWGSAAAAFAAAVLLTAGQAAAQAPATPFPDVPPWHWAYQGVTRDAQAGLLVGYPTPPVELVENTLTQVFEGFVHARTPEAQAWVERFTYNRPTSWPGPLERSSITGFVLTGVKTAVTGDAATAAFAASVTPRTGRATTTPMRVGLRLIDGDWKIDYATLAGQNPVFR
ncbi:MAG TPA: hypothetical protein VJT33_16475 [bacterium]|nr:hypothetical protein [bacterium]